MPLCWACFSMWLAIGLSYYLLALSTTGLPVGVAFAFWEGLGLTLITLSSVLILNEALTFKRVLGLICVLAGALLVHHGTGHGVGFVLGVHEGPERVHWDVKRQKRHCVIEEGMIFSNEPGHLPCRQVRRAH